MKFKTIEKEITPILRKETETRADDMRLYAAYVKKRGLDIGKALMDRKYRLVNGLAGYESISRIRRKVQASNPSLRPSKRYIEQRKAAEKEYRAYAKGVKE